MNRQRNAQTRKLIIMIGMLTAILLSACKPDVPQAQPSATIPQSLSPASATASPIVTAATASPTVTPAPTFTVVPALGEIHLGLVWPKQDRTLSAQLAIGADSTIYVMDDEAKLHAVAPDGNERWIYRTNAEFAGAPVMSGDNTAVYIITSNNELISVGTDGKLRWTFKAADAFMAAPVVAPDGTIYLRTRSGGHRVLPDGTGQAFTWPEWTDRRSRVAFDSQSRMTLWNPMKKQLVILAADGTPANCPEEKELLSSGPAIGQSGTVFYTLAKRDSSGSTGTLVARDTACQELWRYSLGTSQEPLADYPLAVGNADAVYASGPDGRVQAIDVKRGQRLWASDPITTTGAPVYLIANPDGALYTLSNQAVLLAFRDGKQIWSHTFSDPGLPGPLETTPDGGLAMIQAGQLYRFTHDTSSVSAQPTPVPPPADRAQAEKEIADFLVDFIVQQEIGGTVDYIRNSGQPWVSHPPKANILIWAPAVDNPGLETGFLHSDQPKRVWWYADGKLTETEDMLKSIEEYKQQYMEKPSSDIWAYGYYEFGVVSMAEDKQSARVYVGASCGPLCGHGFYYTLRRSPSGRWWIIKGDHLWQS